MASEHGRASMPRLRRTWKQGARPCVSKTGRVYPRRAEHNTVAEGGIEDGAVDCASERVPIALGEGRPETPGRRH